MSNLLTQVKEDMDTLVSEWIDSNYLQQEDIFVIGCSTSEVAGNHIGSAGSEEVAQVIFDSLQPLQEKFAIQFAFQCCEHLNRSLVIESKLQKSLGLEEVSAVPVPTAGGSMASYAYKHMKDPVLVEEIQANVGIDIGDTMIGMHVKKVAIPLRFTQRTIGNAHVTAARSRPRLIGGERAQYKR